MEELLNDLCNKLAKVKSDLTQYNGYDKFAESITYWKLRAKEDLLEDLISTYSAKHTLELLERIG